MPLTTQLLLIKVELVFGGAVDTLVAELPIVGGPFDYSSLPVEAEDEEGDEKEKHDPADINPYRVRKHGGFTVMQSQTHVEAPFNGHVQVPLRMDLQNLPISPTHPSLLDNIEVMEDKTEVVGVRYYLRLAVKSQAGTYYWNTHEVFFYRTALSDARGDYSSDGEVEEEEPDLDESGKVQNGDEEH